MERKTTPWNSFYQTTNSGESRASERDNAVASGIDIFARDQAMHHFRCCVAEMWRGRCRSFDNNLSNFVRRLANRGKNLLGHVQIGLKHWSIFLGYLLR